MTNIWKELDLDRWTWEVPRDTPGPYVAEHIPKPLITDWVKKWKPIINEALEKADIHDRYVKHIASLEEYGVWGSINRLDDKIETIKKLTEPFIEWGGPHDAFYRVRLHKHPELQEYVSELMKVLYPDVQSPEVKPQ